MIHWSRNIGVRVMLAAALLSTTIGAVNSEPLAAAATPVVQAETIAAKLIADGRLLRLDEGQFILMDRGRVYIPLRAAASVLQRSVVWDGKAQSVSIAKPTASEKQSLASYLNMHTVASGTSAPGGRKVRVAPVAVKFYSDGRAAVLPKDQSAYSLGGTIYVPIRFLADLAGVSVTWTSQNLLIELKSPSTSGSGGGAENGLSGGGAGAGSDTGSTDKTGGTDKPDGAISAPPSNVPYNPVLYPPIPPQSAPSVPVPSPSVPSPAPSPTAPSPPPIPSQPTPPAASPVPANPPQSTPTPAPTPPPGPKPALKEIQGAAEDSLNELLIQCENRMIQIAMQYTFASSAAVKQKLRLEGEAAIASCDSAFEAIMVNTRNKLETYGYSTSILVGYRQMYDQEKARGQQLLQDMLMI